MTLKEKIKELEINNPLIEIEDEDYNSLYFGRCKGIYNEPMSAPLAKTWKTFIDVFGNWEVIEEIYDSAITLVIRK